jgi:dTDP-4-amino-4,6-dideoxygalactose transaminase
MSFRRQLPVWSPVTMTAVTRALAAELGGGGDEPGAPNRSLASLLRAEYAADDVQLYGSGTQALQVAIAALLERHDKGAHVALPAFGCYDLASAAVWSAAPIALYDVNPMTLTPDLASLERVIAAGARVIVIAPLYGIPIPWEPIAEIARAARADLIEDAAQGHGASWRERLLGSIGSVSILSFGRGKGWTGGGGGALLTRGTTIALPSLPPKASGGIRTAVSLAAQLALGRPTLYGAAFALPGLHLGETIYHSPRAPLALGRGAAAAVLATHALARKEAESRRINARILLDRVDLLGTFATPTIDPEGVPGYLRLPVRFATPPDEVARTLERAGAARSYPTPLDALPVIRDRLAGAERRWPGAESLAQDLWTLPTHSGIGDRDIAALSEGTRWLVR